MKRFSSVLILALISLCGGALAAAQTQQTAPPAAAPTPRPTPRPHRNPSLSSATQTTQAPPTTQPATSATPRPKPRPTPRPVKNPPQYLNIIDLDNKEDKTAGKTSVPETRRTTAPVNEAPATAADLVHAVNALAGEVKQLVTEMRALNVRQQAQIDMLRLTRGDLRIDSYEREWQQVRARLGQLEMDEQTIKVSLTPEALEAQANRFGGLNRDETIKQIRNDLESRLQVVVAEKERLQQREAELTVIITGFRETNQQTEQKIKMVEEALRQLTSTPLVREEKQEPSAERKPMP